MRSTRTAIAVFGLVLCSCASAGVASGPADESSAPTLQATLSPLPSAISSSTPTPVTPVATATPFGAAIFDDPDECTSPQGYRVAYPDAWYSNAAVPNPFDPAEEGIPACSFFAPRDFATTYGTEPSADVAIWMGVSELAEGQTWSYGPFDGKAVVSDAPVSIAGYPGRVQEIEVTFPDTGHVEAGDRFTTYTLDLGGNRYLYARTANSKDYPASHRVLADMMRTLEVTRPRS